MSEDSVTVNEVISFILQTMSIEERDAWLAELSGGDQP